MSRLEDFWDYRAHPTITQEVGIIALNFAMLEGLLAKVLSAIVQGRDYAAAAIFIGVENNRSRREVVISAARICLGPQRKALVTRIEERVERFRSLASQRNKILHTPWLIGKRGLSSTDLKRLVWREDKIDKGYTLTNLKGLNRDLLAEMPELRKLAAEINVALRPSPGKSRSSSNPRTA